MITFFTVPKSFQERHISVIQHNAILSWKNLNENNEVIIYGNEYGISEFANSNNFLNINDIEYNEFGTPMLDNIFKDVQRRSKNDIIIYCNSDIIFLNDLNKIVNSVKRKFQNNNFLIFGRRIDLDIKKIIDFKSKNWKNKLLNNVENNGNLHGFSGIDYFIFNKNQVIDLPPFAVGRMGWDNWFIYNAIKIGIQTVDATYDIKAVHQNHKSNYSISDLETKKNIRLINGFNKVATIYDSRYITRNNILDRVNVTRRLISYFKLTYPFNYIFALRRKFMHTFYK